MGGEAPTPVREVDLRVGFEDPPIVWIGSDRIALLASGSVVFRMETNLGEPRFCFWNRMEQS